MPVGPSGVPHRQLVSCVMGRRCATLRGLSSAPGDAVARGSSDTAAHSSHCTVNVTPYSCSMFQPTTICVKMRVFFTRMTIKSAKNVKNVQIKKYIKPRILLL